MDEEVQAGAHDVSFTKHSALASEPKQTLVSTSFNEQCSAASRSEKPVEISFSNRQLSTVESNRPPT
eukprot:2125708-Rhodomonas_salina.1